VRREKTHLWKEIQTAHSTRPSYSNYSSFFFSSYSYLNVHLFYNHLFRTFPHLFSFLLAKFPTLFLLLFFFAFPLLTLFLALLFPLHRSLLSLSRYFIHFRFILVRPYPTLFHIILQDLLALNQKQVHVKM